MLIRHPTLLLKHTMTCSDLWGTVLSTFPKVFTSVLFAWSMFAYHVTNSALELSAPWFWFTELLGWSTCLLCVYTYYKIIWVGPGSPLDYHELRYHTRKSQFVSGCAGSAVTGSAITTNAANTTGSGSAITAASGSAITAASAGFVFDNPLPEEESLLPSPSPLTLPSSDSGASIDPIESPPPKDVMEQHPLDRRAHRGYNVCLKCQVWKPDRAHHCSSCRRCILRMDHHCPWFACCIGFHNQKYFVQFLFYVAGFSCLCFVVSLYNLYLFLWQEQLYAQGEFLLINSVMLFVVSIAFTLAVTSFALFLAYLVVKNTTTIEFQGDDGLRRSYEYDSHGKKKKLGNIYDLGWRRNWRQTMGSSWLQWLLPINSTSFELTPMNYNNGVNFEVDPHTYENWCRNIFLQDRLDEQLLTYRNKLILNRRDADIAANSLV